MEKIDDIVIVGAGIAGLATALGLHRLGLRSLVLESSESLRITGFALTLWKNAWTALDALGIGDSLRQHSIQIRGFGIASADPGLSTTKLSQEASRKLNDLECRCVSRKKLLETLEKEVPRGTIRYSSRVVSIDDFGHYKLLHLADGSTVKAKVLIGCDGINSVVTKWLGFSKAVNAGRSALRGFVEFSSDEGGHGFGTKFSLYFGHGVRFGLIPCDDKSLYWFCTFQHEEGLEKDPVKRKQSLLCKMSNAPEDMQAVVERTQLDFISCVVLKLRQPWQVLLGNIAKDNVCVAGDALHPMTPDLGQGGCSALEDGVVLARCLGEAFAAKPKDGNSEEEFGNIRVGLAKYARERRWRSFNLIYTAYLIGWIQSTGGMLMRFLREKFLARWTVHRLLQMADFDFGTLHHA